MRTSRPSPHYRLFSLLFAFVLALALVPSSVSAQAGPPDVPGDEEETVINDLSTPVIWVGDTAMATVTDTAIWDTTNVGVVITDAATGDVTTWYLMSDSDWTAANAYATDVTGLDLSTAEVTVDWGDNISEDQEWVDGRFVRIEFSVLVTLPEPMEGFVTVNLLDPATGYTPEELEPLYVAYPELEGAKEIWATTGEVTTFTQAYLYDPTTSLTIIYDGDETQVAMSEDVFSAEINQSGKLIYGTQWQTATDDYGEGTYTVVVTVPVLGEDVAFSQTILVVSERTGGPSEGTGNRPPDAGNGGQSGGGGNPPTDPGQGGGGQGGAPTQPEGVDVDDQPGQGGGGNVPTDPGQGGSDNSGGNPPANPDPDDAVTPPADSGQGGSGQQGGSGGSGGSGGNGTVPDNDGDGLANNADNCVEVANPDQADADTDGIGDVCDPEPDVPGEPVEEDGPPDDRGGGAPEGSGPGSEHEGEHDLTPTPETGS